MTFLGETKIIFQQVYRSYLSSSTIDPIDYYNCMQFNRLYCIKKTVSNKTRGVHEERTTENVNTQRCFELFKIKKKNDIALVTSVFFCSVEKVKVKLLRVGTHL